jgi:hypothetical protein
MSVMVLTVGAYVAVRAVSLHQIDSVLYRRELSGLRVGTLIEYAVLLVAGAATMWEPHTTGASVPRGRSRELRV